jgi:hypothetical protein
MVGVKIADMTIFKAWFGSLKDFIAVATKPGVGAPSDDPAVLTKWMVSGMYCLILSYLVNIGYYAVNHQDGMISGLIGGAIAFIQFACYAFLSTWILWYGFVHRETPCCAVCIFCIEDWKPMHLVAGCLLTLSGVLQVLTYAATLPGMLANMGLATILYIVFVVFYAFYAVCLLCAGLCLIKSGGKKAGIEVPGADKIGA